MSLRQKRQAPVKQTIMQSLKQLASKAKKEQVKEQREHLKKAAEAQNIRTANLIKASLIQHPNRGNDESLQIPLQRDNTGFKKNPKARAKEELRKRRDAERSDILAYKRIGMRENHSNSSQSSRSVATQRTNEDLIPNVNQVSKRNAKNVKAVARNSNHAVTTKARAPTIVHENVQLFGPNHPEPMHDIGNGIFCKCRIVRNALYRSHNSGQCGRKLLTGVFTLKAILNCSLSGRTYKRENETNWQAPRTLYGPAVRQIIAFTKVNSQPKWSKMGTDEVKHAMRRKINQINRDYKLAVKHNQIYIHGDY